MAITEIKESAFLSGNFERDTYSYLVEYQVYTDSHLDGPDTIRRDAFFRLGKKYSFGNDQNPSATLKSVNVKTGRRFKNTESATGGFWRVECSFDTKIAPGEKPEDGGGGSGGDDPPDVPDDDDDERIPRYVQIVYQTKREIINRAKWLKTWKQPLVGKARVETTNSFNKYHGGKYIGPVCSSAFVPKVPAPEREIAYPVIRLGGSIGKAFLRFEFDQVASMPGKINNKEFDIRGPADGFETFLYNFPKHTLKISNVSIGKLDPIKGLFVPVEVEIIVDMNKHTIMDLDEGFSIFASDGSFNDRINNKNPETEILRDERGAPLQNPVLLNGLGEVLPKGTLTTDERNKQDVFYNEFIDYASEADFSTFDLLDPKILF